VKSGVSLFFCFPGLEFYINGPGSSVGIVTDYALEGPGSNSGGEEIFQSFRPALRPTQPTVKWVSGQSRW
jgi:hypothetical protein